MPVGSHRRHPLLRALFGVLACLAWVSGTVGPQLHHVFVQHVLCEEHGVVEHASSRAREVADTPSIQEDESDHGEICALECVQRFAPSVRAPGPQIALEGGYPAPIPLVDPAAPRGPPLRYAPKTSPPAAS